MALTHVTRVRRSLNRPSSPAGRGRIRLTIAMIALVVLQAAAASAMQGQVVRGRLVDEGDNAAIAGAMITLVDRDGRGVERMLTRSGIGVAGWNQRLNSSRSLGTLMLPQQLPVNSEPCGGNAPWITLIPRVSRNSATGTKSRSDETSTAMS